jgi:hypothetical protein
VLWPPGRVFPYTTEVDQGGDIPRTVCVQDEPKVPAKSPWRWVC